MKEFINVLIFGGTGGLGIRLVPQLCQATFEQPLNVYGVSSKECDIRFLSRIQEVCNKFEPDVVINLAGVNPVDSFIHKLTEREQHLIHYLIDVNVKGAVNIATACLPGMRDRGFGRIIFASSVLATKNVLGTGLYSASKAFVDRLVKTISAENIAKGVTCNSIQLGYFDGGMTHTLKDQEKFKEKIPLKRWGKISELANIIEFLIKTEYCTGTSIEINGGV